MTHSYIVLHRIPQSYTEPQRATPRLKVLLKIIVNFLQANAVTREVFDQVTRYIGVNEVQYFGLMIIKGMS